MFLFRHLLPSVSHCVRGKESCSRGDDTGRGVSQFQRGAGKHMHQRLTRLPCSAPSGRLMTLPAFIPSLVGTAKCERFNSTVVKLCLCICREEERQVRNQMGQNSHRFLLRHSLPRPNTFCPWCAFAHSHACMHVFPWLFPSPQTGCSPHLARCSCAPV